MCIDDRGVAEQQVPFGDDRKKSNDSGNRKSKGGVEMGKPV